MKKLTITLLCAGVCSCALAQSNSDGRPETIIDIGANKLSINDVAVNAWARNNYNLDANPAVGGFLEAAIFGKWDAGMRLSINQPAVMASLEFGKRLTGRHSPIASYLNLDWGDFNFGFDQFKLLNYKLPPDQQGQDMELQTKNTYFGITSRNYLTRLALRSVRNRRVMILSGFYITEGWMPYSKYWKYGYYKDDGSDADGDEVYNFTGGRVSGIPKISSFFTDAGIFVGIAF